MRPAVWYDKCIGKRGGGVMRSPAEVRKFEEDFS